MNRDSAKVVGVHRRVVGLVSVLLDNGRNGARNMAVHLSGYCIGKYLPSLTPNFGLLQSLTFRRMLIIF